MKEKLFFLKGRQGSATSLLYLEFKAVSGFWQK
jgi:hypothetical protein